MNTAWKKVKIKDIGSVITGNTPPRKNPEFYGNHTLFIKPTDIQEDVRYTKNPEECYSEIGFKKYKNSLIPKGSTCVVTIGSIGKKITQAHCDCFVNQAVNAVVPSKDYDENFVYYLLKHNLNQVKGLDSGTASGRENVSKTAFSNIEVLVPNTLETQTRIANILSAYDDLIENNLRRIKLLEEMAELTYREWFVNFKIDGKPLEIDKNTGLPFGWERRKLKDLGEVITGKTPPTTNTDFFDGKIPFVKTPDMSNFPYVIETTQCLSELGANSQKNKFLPKNSLMVSCIGSAGVVGLTAVNSQTNQQINSIRFFKDCYVFYTYLFSKKLKPLLEGLGSNGATMTNVNKGKFENIEITIPKESILLYFHEIIKPKFQLILQLQNQNRLLKESRDILLPRLMSGELGV